jgi:hypothetical protein
LPALEMKLLNNKNYSPELVSFFTFYDEFRVY